MCFLSYTSEVFPSAAVMNKSVHIVSITTSITFNIDFLKIRKVLCSRFFHIFLNIPLKYSSLYTRLQIILKRLYQKVIQQNSF